MNLSPLNRVLSICIFLMGSFYAQGQDRPPEISAPNLETKVICGGSQVQIDFQVTNGYDLLLWVIPYNFKPFTSRTNYEVVLKASGSQEQIIASFTSNDAPGAQSVSAFTIRKTVNIPGNLPSANDYHIFVRSDNPSATSQVSSNFEITHFDTPEVEYIPQTCIGAPIQLTASKISGASYSWTGPNRFTSREQNPVITNISETSAGEYSVVVTMNGCSSEPASVYVDPYPAHPGNEDTAGQDSWIGHVYDGLNFNRYVGHYTEPEVFDQDFGGNETCFEISGGVSIYPETFSVKYRMNSSKKGLYSVDLGSDDGSRLSIDGQEVYNSWGEQSYTERSNVLLSLNGESQLEYHYYENRTNNRIRFGEPNLLIKNIITSNLEQEICAGTEALEISGDTFGNLPSGIEKLGTGYQWLYSTSKNGNRKTIEGVNSANFTPNLEMAPFNEAGTYYVYRAVVLTSGNNFNGRNYQLAHESNPAILEIAAPINNNEITFKAKQEFGRVSKSAGKGQTLYLEAPEGGVFTEINSARFIALGGIVNLDASSVVAQYVLGNNFAAIPVTHAVFERVGWWAILDFRLEVEAAYTYSASTCSGQDLGTIKGSIPEGGNGSLSYLWESSTSSAVDGFSSASGENTSQDYMPDNLSGTTWFRRSVISGNCEVTSNVIEIKVQANEWTGAEDRRWNSTANWSCGEIPGLRSNVVIPADVDHFPLIKNGEANGKVHDLFIENGASLEIQENWFQIAGTVTNEGSFKAVTGSIAFVGEKIQIFPTLGLQENRIANLYIDNPLGMNLQGKLEITQSLNVQKGTFHTANALTLISDANGTALIDGSGMGDVHGKITLQRYLNPAFGYKYFSSPLKDVKVGDFAPHVGLNAGFQNFYRYNENREDALGNDATGWEGYTDPNAPLHPLEGYAINFGKEKKALTISITGEVNNGNQSIQLKNNQGKYTQGFNLVGNPYPSPINWDAAGWTKNNIDDAIYFFTASEDSQYTGTYKSYAAGVSSDGSRNSASNIIPSMQGFFVHVSDTKDSPVTATLGMTNEVRVVDFEQEFYKSPRAAGNRNPLVRLSARFNKEAMADPAVIYFSAKSTAAFDKDTDALKMMNTDTSVPNLYSLTPDKEQLSINALPFPTSGETRLALGLQAEKSGNMSIQLQDLEAVPGNMNIYLIDLEQRISKKLDQGTEYSFHVNQGVHNNRFELLLSEDVLDDVAVAFHDPFSVSSKGGTLYVKLNLEAGQKGSIVVTSLSGQSLAQRQGSGNETLEFHDIKSAGVYIVTLDLGNSRHSKKVLIGKQ